MELTTHESFVPTDISEGFSVEDDELLKATSILIYANLAASLLTMIINPFTILAMAMHGMLKKTAANLFIASLCFADLIVGMTTFLMKLQVLMIENADYKRLIAIISWAAAGLTVIGKFSSLMTALIIGVDRAIATIIPLQYSTRITHRRGAIVLTFLWTSTCCLVLGPLLINLYSLDEGESLPLLTQSPMAFPRSFIQYLATPMIIGCLFGNALLYIAIVTAFNRISKKTSTTDKHSNRLTKISIIVVSSLILGTTPISIFVSLPSPADLTQQLRVHLIYNVLQFISIIPTFANNFIYAWHLAEFRKAYGRLLRCHINTAVGPG